MIKPGEIMIWEGPLPGKPVDPTIPDGAPAPGDRVVVVKVEKEDGDGLVPVVVRRVNSPTEWVVYWDELIGEVGTPC